MVIPALFVVALGLAPSAQAAPSPSARVTPDTGTAASIEPSTSVGARPSGFLLTVRRDWAAVPSSYEWRISLDPAESLTRLRDGSVAIVAPWPDESGDGTDYSSPDGSPGATDHDVPPLPPDDPYRYSADPDGSMAKEEALHDVGPFDPCCPDEYLPDPWALDDPSDPDSPVNANSGPPPKADTRDDAVDPSDNEPVPETDPLDAVYSVEDSRPDQVVALIERPRASDALGRGIPVRLVITSANTVELRFAPVLTAAFPFTASARLIFNPDALP